MIHALKELQLCAVDSVLGTHAPAWHEAPRMPEPELAELLVQLPQHCIISNTSPSYPVGARLALALASVLLSGISRGIISVYGYCKLY